MHCPEMVKILILCSYLQLISELKASGLRGRGGAGFPSGLKYVSDIFGQRTNGVSWRERERLTLLFSLVFHELQGLGQGQPTPLPGC